MFDLLSRMMDSKAASQAEVARVQMESKKSEMEMMLRVVDGRREDKDLAMDKMLELLQLGMQWKTGMAPPGEEPAAAEKPDWIASLVQGLATLISSKVSIPAVDNPAAAPQLPGPAAPAPPTPEAQAAREKKIADIAEAAAKAAVARHKARQEVMAARRRAQEANGTAPEEGGAVPPPAASSLPPTESTALMSELLNKVIVELDTLPVRSETVQLAFDKAPMEWRAKLCATGSALELANYFKPYADMALVKQVEEKITPSPEKQQWLMTQAGTLRSAFIKQAASVASVEPVVPPPTLRPSSTSAGSGQAGPSAALRPDSTSAGSGQAGPVAETAGGPANA